METNWQSDNEAVLTQVHALTEAIEAPGIDDVLECFTEHCIVNMPETREVLEGRGSVRSHFRRLAPQLRTHGGIQQDLISIEIEHGDWALVRTVLRPKSPGNSLALLTLSLNKIGNQWRIAYVVWQTVDEQRVA